jgi:phage tail-like protein
MLSFNENSSPIPKFSFLVDFGTEMKGIIFQEVSGMEVENQVIEYRNSNSAIVSTIEMHSISKYGTVTMKKGVFTNNSNFWKWYAQISMNTIARTTVLIKLLDENGNITMQWQLNNAWPTKITSADLTSDGNEIAINMIEIAHEMITTSAN